MLRLVHDTFICEVVDPETDEPVGPGETGELILTTLGRYACPLIRYRTRDLVKPVTVSGEPSEYFALEGGILGRTDDMVVVRGVNLYPSAVDAVVRSISGVKEYQVYIDTTGTLAQVSIRVDIEGESKMICAALSEKLRGAFHMRIDLEPVEPGSLPVFEMKAKRWNIKSK